MNRQARPGLRGRLGKQGPVSRRTAGTIAAMAVRSCSACGENSGAVRSSRRTAAGRASAITAVVVQRRCRHKTLCEIPRLSRLQAPIRRRLRRGGMLLLFDYSSLLYRAFFSMPESVAAHGVHGLSLDARGLILDRRPTGLVIAVDDDWRPAFRVSALPSYKTHRLAAADEPDPIGPQEALGRDVLRALGVADVGAEGFEAEDVIATLAARATGDVEIASGDRDCFALVRDPHVRVLYPQKGVRVLVEVDEAEVTRRYGIPARTATMRFCVATPRTAYRACPASARRPPLG